MKHSARQRTLLTLTLLILMLVSIAPAAAAPTVPLATTVFSESMYDGTGSPSGTTPIATFESNNYFQNDALTMSGTGDMRTTTPSSGYTSASGTWNVFLTNTTAGRYFQIADINTTGYTNLTLSFGVYKSTTVENGSTFDVAVSSNGSNWTSLTIPALPTGTGTAIWHYRTTSGTIPATSTLFIRFTNTGTATQFRIDDVLLEGDQDGGDAAPSVTSTVPANNAPAVALNADVTVTFSEPVDVTGTWFDITCTGSGNHTAAVSGGPIVFTLNPDTDFSAGETCTGTIYAAQVTDQDSNDPPDNMAADYVWSFSTQGGAVCGGAATLIHDIQGSGAASPLSGVKTIEGIVVGDFQPVAQLGGFFVQEEIADQDANPLTSEGIFVYQGSSSITDLNVGDKVRLTGTISEYADRTVGGGTLTQLTSPTIVAVCSTGNAVTPVDVTLPEATDGDLERYEGMLIHLASATVAQNYWLGRYGQMTLSGSGRLYQPTNQYLPNSAGAIALASLNARSQVILDDGKAGVRCGDNPNPVPYLGPPPLNVIRSGDTVEVVGVLDYGQIDSTATGASCSVGTTTFGGDYRIHPAQAPVFTPANPRPAAPDSVPGNVKVAAANVLNFFNGDGNKGGFPTSRGADTFTEFVRQRIKLYEEISRLNGDIVTLMELENDGFGANSAIAEMVKILNDGPCWNSATECAALGYSSSGMGAGTYAFVNMGGTVGTDEITVGVIYKPGKVTLVGTPQALTAVGYTDPNSTGTQKSRPAIAATFEENTWGERFTVVANHLKSKGCSSETGLDVDQGDGQGCWNDTRKKGAAYLVNTWLPTDPTASGDPDYLLTGDMNAYAQEDPIIAFSNSGYTDQINRYVGSTAYSYIFDGLSGYLDHALANATLHPQVLGTTEWHNNVDEPPVIDYNLEFNQVNGYYVPNQYRASDHDPVLVGLGLYADQSDLPAYGVAWHTGQGTPWRLGTTWTGDASSGLGTDTDDGVTRNYSDSWNDGQGEIYVTVTGPAGQYACLNAWLDYSDGVTVPGTPDTPNGAFDGNEHVVDNLSMQAGANQLVTFQLPGGVMNGGSDYNMRVRLVPDPNNDTNCGDVTAAHQPAGGAQTTGRADGGEVEDYTFNAGPLAVTLASFDAQSQPNHVLVSWETVSETGNAGFNLYRADSATAPQSLLAFVPSQAPGSAQGHSYAWQDGDVVDGQTYWYWLEDIALNGATTLHGPVSVTFQTPTAVALTDMQASSSDTPTALPALLVLLATCAVLMTAAAARRRSARS